MLTTGTGPRPFVWTIHVQLSWSSPGSGPARPTCPVGHPSSCSATGTTTRRTTCSSPRAAWRVPPVPGRACEGRRVAVLGAGVMGTSTALFLARRGCDVTLVDREGAAMRATSRWNEGKIHLGYLYGADSSLNTARHVIPGGLMFGSLLEQLIGRDLDSHTTSQDDIYLVHRDSVVGTQVVRAQFRAVSELVRQHPDASRYLTDVSAARATERSPAELRAIAGDDIVAGLRVPERSVNTRWVADQLVAAVDAEDRVTLQTGTEVPVSYTHLRAHET